MELGQSDHVSRETEVLTQLPLARIRGIFLPCHSAQLPLIHLRHSHQPAIQIPLAHITRVSIRSRGRA